MRADVGYSHAAGQWSEDTTNVCSCSLAMSVYDKWGVLSVYVVHGLMRVAFVGWHVPLRPMKPWYWEHMMKVCV